MNGCYGLRWNGLDEASDYLTEVPSDAVELTVRRRRAEHEAVPEEMFTHGSARLRLSDGSGVAEVRLAERTVTLSVKHEYDDEAVLHPLLAGSAAAVNHWLGRDSFHAGAVVVDGRAWIVMGDKGDGKSTTLGYLAERGLGVLADDLIVVDGGSVWAGPGFIDLRPDAAQALGVGRDIGWLGARMRARLDIGPRPARAPVAGWLTLSWADTLELRQVPLAERLGLLYEHRTVRHVPPDPVSYLAHASRPCYELARPKDWSQLPAVHDLLVSVLST